MLSERGTDCDATCQQAVYNGFGNISSEIAYTLAGCILKNTVGELPYTTPTASNNDMVQELSICAQYNRDQDKILTYFSFHTDLTSSSSVLITVAKSLGVATDKYAGTTVASLGGIVVQSLQAGLGDAVGSALASFVSPP